MAYDIVLKRIYADASAEDGARVLVDRLWPRGKRRENLELTDWYRDGSPSNTLRRQYHRGEITQDAFADHYHEELQADPESLVPLMRYARQGRLTLLSAIRNLDKSHLPVLRDALIQALRNEDNADSEPASPPCFTLLRPPDSH